MISNLWRRLAKVVVQRSTSWCWRKIEGVLASTDDSIFHTFWFWSDPQTSTPIRSRIQSKRSIGFIIIVQKRLFWDRWRHRHLFCMRLDHRDVGAGSLAGGLKSIDMILPISYWFVDKRGSWVCLDFIWKSKLLNSHSESLILVENMWLCTVKKTNSSVQFSQCNYIFWCLRYSFTSAASQIEHFWLKNTK